jgi:hypothetical protein
MKFRLPVRPLVLVSVLMHAWAVHAESPVPTVSGWALMRAATLADGPTSGQFAAPNPYGTNLPPYPGKQPVQGFSGVLSGPGHDSFRFLTDNGFGARGNSADALLRMYAVKVDFRMLKTDEQGTVLRKAIPRPGVRAPENVEVLNGTATANLSNSGGFEGMAINASGTRLYTQLEKTVAGDAAGTLRINEFDLARETYTGQTWFYPLDSQGTNIGDMTAIDDEHFIVIERNSSTATATAAPTPFKKLFLVDISGVANGGTVRKVELVDLMNLADPHDLNRDGKLVYTMPFVTIEDVLVLDDDSLLVVNDNNFPYGGGRTLASDDTEFVRITLPYGLHRHSVHGYHGHR